MSQEYRPAPDPTRLTPHPDPPPQGGREGVWRFLTLVWLVMTLAALGYVLAFGHNIPWGDEWEFVPALTGREPAGLPWLWAQHNEHRLPLPRAIYLGLFRLTGDFRAGMVLQVV